MAMARPEVENPQEWHQKQVGGSQGNSVGSSLFVNPLQAEFTSLGFGVVAIGEGHFGKRRKQWEAVERYIGGFLV